jgi:hypothetical protein
VPFLCFLFLFSVGFISSLPQLAWDKRLSCCCCCCKKREELSLDQEIDRETVHTRILKLRGDIYRVIHIISYILKIRLLEELFSKVLRDNSL